MTMEKYYDIERAAGALAKFPGQKSDLKDFIIKKKWWKSISYWKGGGSPGQISRT